MQRPIKFRMWQEQSKVMSPTATLTEMMEVTIRTQKVLYPENIIFEQFTGLYDVHAREVYEGDIVRFQLPLGGFWGNTPNVKTAPIVYNDDAAMFEARWDYSKDQHSVRLGEVKLEVVGNIHQNPKK